MDIRLGKLLREQRIQKTQVFLKPETSAMFNSLFKRKKKYYPKQRMLHYNLENITC